jgi:hypothetical protein
MVFIRKAVFSTTKMDPTLLKHPQRTMTPPLALNHLSKQQHRARRMRTATQMEQQSKNCRPRLDLWRLFRGYRRRWCSRRMRIRRRVQTTRGRIPGRWWIHARYRPTSATVGNLYTLFVCVDEAYTFFLFLPIVLSGFVQNSMNKRTGMMHYCYLSR